MGFSVLAIQTQAQTIGPRAYNLHVSAPASVAGDYTPIPAQFGSQEFCTDGLVTGEWVIIEDEMGGTLGCGSVVNDMTGKIALIDRGTCNFSIKCYNAQEAGAVGAIVCNNADTDPFAMAPGTNSELVTIPCFMMSKADCDLIRVETPLTIEFEPVYSVNTSTDIVVWGDQVGQGDFNGGLNGWTIENISCGDGSTPTIDLWQFTADGTVAGGAFGDGAINGWTACDGAMYFYSDFYDNDGDDTNLGFGVCPAVQEGTLTSPMIDISGTTAAGLTLKFVQTLRQFQTEYFVGWSTDGGATWTEAQINAQYPVNSGNEHEVVRVPMPGVVGNANVWVRFRELGNYYYWIVDDVQIVEQEAYNLQIANNFFAVMPNAQFPAGQMDPVPFLTDIANVGAADQDDVVVDLDIVEDASSTSVFSSQIVYDPIPGNTLDGDLVENHIFPEMWTPDAMINTGSYTGTYVVSSGQTDFNDADNSATFAFEVTTGTFAKDLGQTRDVFPAASNYDVDEAHSWGYGNYYYVQDATDMVLESASFYVRNAEEVPGRSLLVSLYTWEDMNADGNADPDERVRVALAPYTIEGTETDDQLITVPVLAFPSNVPYEFVSETQYILMIEYVTEDQVDFAMGATEDFDYAAMLFVTDSLDAPRFAGMLGVNGTLDDEPYSSAGFGNDIAPVVHMNVTFSTGTTELLPVENTMEVFPNPTSGELNVQLGLVNTYEQATLELFSNTGQRVYSKQYQNVQNDLLTVDVSRLSTGMYWAVIVTKDGIRSRRFSVQK